MLTKKSFWYASFMPNSWFSIHATNRPLMQLNNRFLCPVKLLENQRKPLDTKRMVLICKSHEAYHTSPQCYFEFTQTFDQWHTNKTTDGIHVCYHFHITISSTLRDNDFANVYNCSQRYDTVHSQITTKNGQTHKTKTKYNKIHLNLDFFTCRCFRIIMFL